MHNEKSVKEYVLDNAHNAYRVFINRVLKGLVDKGLLKEVTERYGDTEFIAFESPVLFKTKCPEFMRYLMGDIDTIRLVSALCQFSIYLLVINANRGGL